MPATITLMNISEKDIPRVGYKAADLAHIAQKKYNVPPSFVIPCELFSNFLTHSGIQERLSGIYAKHPSTEEGYKAAYEEIKELFHKVAFSDQLKEELAEAYESLSLPFSSSAQDIVASKQSPTVQIILSPDYEDQSFNVLQNIQGEQNFLHAVKEAWLLLYLPQAVMSRSTEPVSTGLIVQQQLPTTISAEGTYSAEKQPEIIVRSYYGQLDANNSIPKDAHFISAEHLQIVNRQLLNQPQAYLDGKLTNIDAAMKISDQQLLEIARITKRIHLFLERDCSVYFSTNKDVFVLFATRGKKIEYVQAPVVNTTTVLVEEPEEEPLPIHESPAELTIQETPVAPPVQAPVDQPLSVDAAPLDLGESSVQTPEVQESSPQESSLFDLYQPESENITFIKETFQKLQEHLAQLYQTHYNQQPPEFTELITALELKTALTFPKEDLHSLHTAHGLCLQGNEPTNDALGIAWKIQSGLK